MNADVRTTIAAVYSALAETMEAATGRPCVALSGALLKGMAADATPAASGLLSRLAEPQSAYDEAITAPIETREIEHAAFLLLEEFGN